MQQGLQALNENNSWSVIPLPKGKKGYGLSMDIQDEIQIRWHHWDIKHNWLHEGSPKHMVSTTRKLSAALEENGFKRCNVDHYLFFQTKSGERLVVLIYVDDLIVTSTNPIAVANLKWIFH